MQRVVQMRDALVAAVDGKRVLGQIVRSDAEEIALRRENPRRQRRRRHLDHDPDLEPGIEGTPLRLEFAAHLIDHRLRCPQLVQTPDHRQEQAHVAERAGAQDRPELGPEGAGILEGEADRATAELGILLVVEADVGDALVAAEVEGADRDRARLEKLDDALVKLLLLLFGGEAAVGQRKQFRSKQTDAFGAVFVDKPEIGEQTGVGGELDAAAVESFGRALAEGIEMLDSDLVAVLRLLELAREGVVGGEIERAGGPVDDRLLPVSRESEQSGGAGDGGDLEGSGEDHAVGREAAVLRDDRGHLVHLELGEDRWQQLIDDDH